ncbi:MAG: IS4 family transposase [Candidatus Saccharibacteria bacterium]|nr:IS4 family transposase [Candidatus Saccharibacteria bacterium]
MISNNDHLFFSPSTIKNRLYKAIDYVSHNVQSYCFDPISNFTRKRKLSCADVIRYSIRLSNKSIQSEFLIFFQEIDSMPSPSAFCQQRYKLSASAFRRVFSLFTQSFENYKTYKGYHLLACDGSDISVYHKKNDSDTYHIYSTATKGFNSFHLNALYDIENGIFQDVYIDTATKTRECSALEHMVKERNYPDNSIFICDRGYEKYQLLATLIENNQKFIIRVKDIHSNGILCNLNLPDTSFDTVITKTITRVNNKTTMSQKDKYAVLMNDSPFDYIDFENEFYELKLRVIRFKITDSTYECLVTNLTEDEIAFDEFMEIYHKRWSIETAFKDLKYTIGMLYIHSANQEIIKQEIYSSLILFNYCKLIILNTPPEEKGGKWKYKTNFKMAVTNLRMYLDGYIEQEELIKRIKKFLIPIRPGRVFARQVKPQSFKPYNYFTA